MVRSLRPLLLILFAACSGSGGSDAPVVPDPDEPPLPPAGTGVDPIDMNGTWAMVEIARRDGLAALPQPVPGAPPFLPVQQGQLLSVMADRLCDERGDALYEFPQPGPDDSYVNVADGRRLWFLVVRQQTEPCPIQFAVQAVFGSSGPDEMLGYVDVLVLNGCPGGLIQVTQPNGSFLVRLARVFDQDAFDGGQPASAR